MKFHIKAELKVLDMIEAESEDRAEIAFMQKCHDTFTYVDSKYMFTEEVKEDANSNKENSS